MTLKATESRRVKACSAWPALPFIRHDATLLPLVYRTCRASADPSHPQRDRHNSPAGEPALSSSSIGLPRHSPAAAHWRRWCWLLRAATVLASARPSAAADKFAENFSTLTLVSGTLSLLPGGTCPFAANVSVAIAEAADTVTCGECHGVQQTCQVVVAGWARPVVCCAALCSNVRDS